MITFIVYLLYAIPSLILYFMTLFVIIKNKSEFSSSFFQLYCYDCLVNFATFLKVFTTLRLPEITCHECLLASSFEWCNKYLPMPFIYSMGYHMAFLQYGITTIISLNRLTVLLNYKLFEPLWKKYCWIIILLLIFLPSLSTSAAFNYPSQFTYLNSTDYYSLTTEMPLLEIYVSLIPFMIIAIIISLIANYSSFKFVKKVQLWKASKAESNFLKILSTTLVIQMIGTFLSTGMLVFEQSDFKTNLSVIRPFVSDGLTLVQPWLLYIFSHSIRKKINTMLGGRKTSVATTSRILIGRSP
ncbi:hypothetical protein CRE_20954 [Caenorhabditis remanei]|uniref:Serpentine receptor class gamma n=1 Tax=Caenorhabditis remanei TaxID=31234 RepID=E3NCR1_CAERE|nr:hypothetical protein CRE_20954 [Caenorhabditis remanei]